MMSRNNPGWGAPRIYGELLKPGIEITEPNGRQMHGATSQAAFTDLVDVP
jgi:hypothetical protein